MNTTESIPAKQKKNDSIFKDSVEHFVRNMEGQNKRRGKNNIGQGYQSIPSSGKWRQPAGGASAGISSDGNHDFSTINRKEIQSQMHPTRPSMMLNTMYSGKNKNKQWNQKNIKDFIPPKTGDGGFKRVQITELTQDHFP